MTRRPRAVLELAVIALMFGAYKLGRLVAAKHVGEAFSNAYVVWDLERILRLPDELSLQALVLRSTALVKAANVYYAAVHFPATAAFLIWLYLRRPGDYLWLRRSLALLTATGLLLHLALPVAPPRMLGRLGFVDTADIYGPAVYGPPAADSLADQYAAMPSLHVGWAILVAIGVIATTRSRWRWLIVAHPVLTALVVVVTANHFWLDGLVAGALLAMSIVVVRAVTGTGEDIVVPDFVPVLPAGPAIAEPSPALPVVPALAAPGLSAAAPPAPALSAPALSAPALSAAAPPASALSAPALPVAGPALSVPGPALPVAGPVLSVAGPALSVAGGPPGLSVAGGPPGLSVAGAVAGLVAGIPDRMPPPVRTRAAPLPSVLRPDGPAASAAEDLADVAGDGRDR